MEMASPGLLLCVLDPPAIRVPIPVIDWLLFSCDASAPPMLYGQNYEARKHYNSLSARRQRFNTFTRNLRPERRPLRS